MYEYKAKYVSNYDGDTIKFEVDLGFNIAHKITVRLKDVDCYEMNSKDEKESKIAKTAKEFVCSVLSGNNSILIKTHKDSKDKYGRYPAEVQYSHASVMLGNAITYKNLTNELIMAGLVRPVYP